MTQYGHEGRHHGVGTPDCPRDLHHHHDERCERPGVTAARAAVAALRDRRQRARETFHDEWSRRGVCLRACDEAIETATRVRVTPELVDAYATADNIDDGLARAFAAAGFEVEE
jgi:hypothetical protein